MRVRLAHLARVHVHADDVNVDMCTAAWMELSRSLFTQIRSGTIGYYSVSQTMNSRNIFTRVLVLDG